MHVAALDIGGTKMAACIADAGGPLLRITQPTQRSGSPDTIAFDPRGVLWIHTDIGPAGLNRGDYVNLGNNQTLACDVATGEVRRFLTGPHGCEVTGMTWTPDGRTMFLNIQHPGEGAGERNDPKNPRRWSNWPDHLPDGRPRSATVGRWHHRRLNAHRWAPGVRPTAIRAAGLVRFTWRWASRTRRPCRCSRASAA